MSAIARQPAAAEAADHDLIVVGGGVYGLTLALEAARRRLRVVLLERDDFGGATSRNNLRILHGGFRYLQDLDLPRFFESVAERRWFLRCFPDLAQPLPSLMPLYDHGLRRRSVMRPGLLVNDLLSVTRNRGVRSDAQLSRGRVVSADAVAERYPGVRREGLRGGALWYDAAMPHPCRVLLELLHRACALGATALNYVEATALLRDAAGRTAGVRAFDREAERELELRAPVVVNAGGPWCRALGAAFDADRAALFTPTLAWNVLFDREALSTHGLAVSRPRRAGEPEGQTFFFLPWQGRLMAGTGHAAYAGPVDRPALSDAQLETFLADLNATAPGLELGADAILRIYAGLLPGKRAGSAELANREAVIDHGAHGGPTGLWSVSGIKFTTARHVAAAVLARAVPDAKPAGEHAPAEGFEQRAQLLRFGPDWQAADEPDRWRDELRGVIADESVLHLDDLVLRRTGLGDVPQQAESVAESLCGLFDWDATRRANELERLKRALELAVPRSGGTQ